MTTPIPNCPQPETPIRDRAWTDEQIAEVCEALLRQRQCDHDGMECIVSREACCIAADMLRSTLTHTRPARSGGVSDADVEGALMAMDAVFSEKYPDRNFDDMDEEDKALAKAGVRAALTHFAKGAEVGGDAEDAARYRWLREHFRFANDSLREIWFDAYTRVSQDDAKDLDKAIDAAVQEQSHE